MTFDGRTWTLRREAPDFSDFGFAQRFTGELDGDTIRGEWLRTADGAPAADGVERIDGDWMHDFDLTYTRQLRRMHGRVALVTGVSRRAGIGFAIARRLAAAGVRVFAHHHVPHDAERAWGADPGGIEAVLAAIGGEVADAGFDLAWPDAPEALFAAARRRLRARRHPRLQPRLERPGRRARTS